MSKPSATSTTISASTKGQGADASKTVPGSASSAGAAGKAPTGKRGITPPTKRASSTQKLVANPTVELKTKGVGFDTLPYQHVKSATRAGYKFNFLVIGDSQIGKSTLMESIFDMQLGLEPSPHDLESFKLEANTYEVQGEAVPVQVTIVETAGYGDVDREKTVDILESYIEDQFKAFFSEELRPRREPKYFLNDSMIHCCIFMMSPKGLKGLDEQVLKRISQSVNVVPVIGKADTLTQDAKDRLKRECMFICKQKGIQLYKFPEEDEKFGDTNKEYNATEMEKRERRLCVAIMLALPLQQLVPFTVIGSSEVSTIKGTEVRARKYPWGNISIESEQYSDFVKFRAATIWTNLMAMVQRTHEVLYEEFRSKTLKELGFSPTDLRQSCEVLLRKLRADLAAEIKATELMQKTKMKNMLGYIVDLQKEYGNMDNAVNEDKVRIRQLEEKIKAIETGKPSKGATGKTAK